MCASSLYEICLDKTCDLLRRRMWKSTYPNPFSSFPVKIVNELLEYVLTHVTLNHENIPPNFNDVLPLLTSGKLVCFKHSLLDLKEERSILGREKVIEVPYHVPPTCRQKILAISRLMDIISRNPNLEELHLNVVPEFDIFRKCEKLRILRFHPSCEVCKDFDFVDVTALSTLKNLEVFYAPGLCLKSTVKVLEMFPKLISIGLYDSLDSLEEIYQRSLSKSPKNFDVNSHLQLRRCVWGTIRRPHDALHLSSPEYISAFSTMVKHAITLCPLLEELLIDIQHKDAFALLGNLKKLTFLAISFSVCEQDCVPELIELLQKMGPQLQHLSIDSHLPIQVDVICECCPHLISIEISSLTLLKHSAETASNLSYKRLKFSSKKEPDNTTGFLFLISNCKDLEELYLTDVAFLDDDLLEEIFELNPLTKLKICYIERCNLTERGYQMFLKKAPSINIVDIELYDETLFFNAYTKYEQPDLHYKEWFDIAGEELFSARLNENRF